MFTDLLKFTDFHRISPILPNFHRFGPIFVKVNRLSSNRMQSDQLKTRKKNYAFKFMEFVRRRPGITKPPNVDLQQAAMRAKLFFLTCLENEGTLVQGTRLAELS